MDTKQAGNLSYGFSVLLEWLALYIKTLTDITLVVVW
jgi:hypothetical protein